MWRWVVWPSGCEDAGCVRASSTGRLHWQADPLCALRWAGGGLAHLHAGPQQDRERKEGADSVRVRQVCARWPNRGRPLVSLITTTLLRQQNFTFCFRFMLCSLLPPTVLISVRCDCGSQDSFLSDSSRGPAEADSLSTKYNFKYSGTYLWKNV